MSSMEDTMSEINDSRFNDISCISITNETMLQPEMDTSINNSRDMTGQSQQSVTQSNEKKVKSTLTKQQLNGLNTGNTNGTNLNSLLLGKRRSSHLRKDRNNV